MPKVYIIFYLLIFISNSLAIVLITSKTCPCLGYLIKARNVANFQLHRLIPSPSLSRSRKLLVKYAVCAV